MSTHEEDFKYNSYHLPYFEGDNPDKTVSYFLSGNVSPMIAEINLHGYNYLSFDLTPLSYLNDQSYIQEQVNLYSQVIQNTPSVTGVSLTINATTPLATQLVQQISNSNIYSFNLKSNNLKNEGMAEFINALSGSGVIHFGIDGTLDDAAIAAMKFNETSVEYLHIFSNNFSDDGIVSLFHNLYDSSVNDLNISHGHLSSDAAAQIDLSQTNITSLNFFANEFEQNALANLSFKDSQVNSLYIEFSSIDAKNLEGLSNNLKGSNVNELFIDFYNYLERVDLSKLDLKDTNVTELTLHNIAGGLNAEIAYLDLTDSNVKTLNLSYNAITDKEITSLHLKDTAVEHLILDYNRITPEGVEILKDIIKDTHIIDVSLASSPQPFETNAFLLTNDHSLPTTSNVLPKQDANVLLASDIFSDNLPSKDCLTAITPIQPPLPLNAFIEHTLPLEPTSLVA